MGIINQTIVKIIFRLGTFFIVSPFLIYLAVVLKGDVILKWPFPFSHLGGAPFQLVVYAILVFIGLALTGIAKLLKTKSK